VLCQLIINIATNQCDNLNFATGKSRMSIVISVLEEWAAIIGVAKVCMDHNVMGGGGGGGACVCVRERERERSLVDKCYCIYHIHIFCIHNDWYID